jgi:hypothetical protein
MCVVAGEVFGAAGDATDDALRRGGLVGGVWE